MRSICPAELDKARHRTGMMGSPRGSMWGLFRFDWKEGTVAVLSSGPVGDNPYSEGWEHVSVSMNGDRSRTPSWEVMARVKDLFWTEEELVLQFHPPKSDYVNHHPGVLHLWRKPGHEIELPPKHLIAPS